MSSPRHQPTQGAASGVSVLALLATLLGVAVLATAAYTWWDTYTYVPPRGGDTTLVGLGYVIAGVLAAPAVLGLIATVTAVALRYRRPTAAVIVAALGLALVSLPAMPLVLAMTTSFL
jgi:uncharacterized membrane protein (UPF0182 family)